MKATSRSKSWKYQRHRLINATKTPNAAPTVGIRRCSELSLKKKYSLVLHVYPNSYDTISLRCRFLLCCECGALKAELCLPRQSVATHFRARVAPSRIHHYPQRAESYDASGEGMLEVSFALVNSSP